MSELNAVPTAGLTGACRESIVTTLERKASEFEKYAAACRLIANAVQGHKGEGIEDAVNELFMALRIWDLGRR